jgi:Spy/CpxP family protein refolding chaperone
MKITKTLMLASVVAAGLMTGLTLQAQDAPKEKPPGEHAGPGPGRPDFAKDLNLTEDQKPKFQAIMKGAGEKRKALREDTSLSQEDKKAKGKALMEDVTKQMKELLTPEQFAKWEKMAPGKGRPPGGPAGEKAPKKTE